MRVRAGSLIRTIAAVLLAGSIVVLAPPTAHATDDPWFQNVEVTNSTFYPAVYDGYKDQYYLQWDTADLEFDSCEASITDSAGNSVAGSWGDEFWYGCGNGSDNHLAWNAGPHWVEGSYPPNGTYTITVTYYPEFGPPVHELVQTVIVATGTKWFQESVSSLGDEFSARGTRGQCSADAYFDEAFLDCWGGRRSFASVRFDFYTGNEFGVKDFKWWVRGEAGCCKRDDSRIIKTVVRDGNNVNIRVKVTRWRSYWVKEVGISWMAKYSI